MPDKEEAFFEEDEAVDEVLSAFESGVTGITSPGVVQFSFIEESVNSAAVETPIPMSARWVSTGSSESETENTGAARPT